MEVQLEDHKQWTRWEKMEFLKETTPVNIHTKYMLEELLMFMSEEYFSEFYEHFCSCNDICRSYRELNEKYGDE